MPHPARAQEWEWDDANQRELADHAITPTEVTQVWANDPVFAPNKKHRPGDWKVIGYTNGGRALTIVIRYDSHRRRVRPITGWDATKGEHTRYLS